MILSHSFNSLVYPVVVLAHPFRKLFLAVGGQVHEPVYPRGSRVAEVVTVVLELVDKVLSKVGENFTDDFSRLVMIEEPVLPLDYGDDFLFHGY